MLNVAFICEFMEIFDEKIWTSISWNRIYDIGINCGVQADWTKILLGVMYKLSRTLNHLKSQKSKKKCIWTKQHSKNLLCCSYSNGATIYLIPSTNIIQLGYTGGHTTCQATHYPLVIQCNKVDNSGRKNVALLCNLVHQGGNIVHNWGVHEAPYQSIKCEKRTTKEGQYLKI